MHEGSIVYRLLKVFIGFVIRIFCQKFCVGVFSSVIGFCVVRKGGFIRCHKASIGFVGSVGCYRVFGVVILSLLCISLAIIA